MVFEINSMTIRKIFTLKSFQGLHRGRGGSNFLPVLCLDVGSGRFTSVVSLFYAKARQAEAADCKSALTAVSSDDPTRLVFSSLMMGLEGG